MLFWWYSSCCKKDFLWFDDISVSRKWVCTIIFHQFNEFKHQFPLNFMKVYCVCVSSEGSLRQCRFIHLINKSNVSLRTHVLLHVYMCVFIQQYLQWASLVYLWNNYFLIILLKYCEIIIRVDSFTCCFVFYFVLLMIIVNVILCKIKQFLLHYNRSVIDTLD